MRRVLITAAVVAVASSVVAAPARAHHRPNAFCSKSGDYCTSAKKLNGKRVLSFRTFAHRGRFKLCVKKRSLSTQECHRFRLKDPNDDGLYTRRVRYRKYYEYKGKGAYNVRWFKAGTRIGPVLGFHE